jgi:hypothetical protein
MEIMHTLIEELLTWMLYVNWKLAWLGAGAGALLLALDAAEQSKVWKRLMYLLSGIAAIPILAYVLIPFAAHAGHVDIHRDWHHFLEYAEYAGASFFIVFAWLRWGERKLNVLAKLFAGRSELERNHRTDVRNIYDFIPEKAIVFDPLDFIQKR